jgi:hypothetical protein
MNLKQLILAAAVLASGQAFAANYSFNYVALASDNFEVVSGDFGSSIAIGDTVTFTLNTVAGSSFSASAGDKMWAILGLNDANSSGAVRRGDYSWSFYNQGVLVSAGSSLGEESQDFHVGPWVSIGFSGAFDRYSWTGTLIASDTGNDNVAFAISGYTSAQLAPVPELEAYAMLIAGLGLMGGVARRRRRRKSA